jgi:hypothetical protein
MKLIPLSALCCSLLLHGGGMARAQQIKTLKFSGREWEARGTGKGGPGPNQWNPNNVWVDKAGMLHLKITRIANKANPIQAEWQCAELTSKERFGMGRYQFQVIGRIDRLDHNVVLGLFDYPTADVGLDGTNEIDIEFAHWGNPKWPNGNYTIYPSAGERGKNDSHTFTYTLEGTDRNAYTTQRFIREADKVTLQSLNGHRDDDQNQFAKWVYAPPDKRLIPQQPLPVHINLWLFQGKVPFDGKEVEVIIKAFAFTPAA